MRDTPRSAFPHFCEIATRWMDNDVYGHVNNVHYYSYFDTAVNRFLIERGVLDIHGGKTVGFVVETGCSYFRSIAFPDTVHVGVRVAKLGISCMCMWTGNRTGRCRFQRLRGLCCPRSRRVGTPCPRGHMHIHLLLI
jgi:hypothetical protein